MKLLLALLFSLPTLVLAYPAVGDFVRFEAKYEGDTVAMERKVLSYDESSDVFEVRVLMTYKDEIIKDETYTQQKTFFFNKDKLNNLLKTCIRREGALGSETIEGVTVKTCSFYNEDAMMTTTIGDVPFGDVRFQIYLEGEEFLDFNLVKFKHGL